VSIRQTFPDIIQIDHNTFLLITDDARSWVRWNTSVRNPNRSIRLTGGDVAKRMTEDGLRVKKRRK
jgi:hypothetical protein